MNLTKNLPLLKGPLYGNNFFIELSTCYESRSICVQVFAYTVALSKASCTSCFFSVQLPKCLLFKSCCEFVVRYTDLDVGSEEDGKEADGDEWGNDASWGRVFVIVLEDGFWMRRVSVYAHEMEAKEVK